MGLIAHCGLSTMLGWGVRSACRKKAEAERRAEEKGRGGDEREMEGLREKRGTVVDNFVSRKEGI